jgi:Dolichyl-phosphate-mannose-protein mannosyltransferase
MRARALTWAAGLRVIATGPAAGLGVVAAITLVAAVAMVLVQSWWLNPDGAGYLYLAHSLLTGHGYAFPDGSLATFRGPVYPLLLAGASLLPGDAAVGAIIVDRLSFVASALLVGLLVRNLTGRWGIGLLAGLIAAVQPLPMVSGARFIVPDGPAVTFALAAMVAATWPLLRLRWLWVLALVVIAGLTKETAALIVIPMAALLLPSRWQWSVAAVVAALVIPFTGIVLLQGEPFQPLGNLAPALISSLNGEVYGGTPWLLAVPFAVFIMFWSGANLHRRDVSATLLMFAIGASIMAYAALASLGTRNGLIGAYGLSAVAAIAIGSAWRHRSNFFRLAVVGLAALFLFESLFTTAKFAAQAQRPPDWESPAVTEAAQWLNANASGSNVATTFYFATRLATLTTNIELSLVPMYTGPLTSNSAASLRFDDRVWWMGSKTQYPPPGDHLLTLKMSDQVFAGIFEQALLQNLTDEHATFLVASGSLDAFPGNAAFDAGLLIPYLQSSPDFTQVFATSRQQLPLWLVIYRVRYPVAATGYPTTAESKVAAQIGADGFNIMDKSQYQELLAGILAP